LHKSSLWQHLTRLHISKTVGASAFFALAFGSIIGVGWMIVIGDWLHSAGPGGTIIAFLSGGVLLIILTLLVPWSPTALTWPVEGGIVVGWCYG
jgi:APA family basic amino acid/polyamine antiporter